MSTWALLKQKPEQPSRGVPVRKAATVIKRSTAITAQRIEDSRIRCLQPQTPPLQTKLEISQPGDKLEQEADRVADRVMRMPTVIESAGAAASGDSSGSAQPLPHEPETLQREADATEEQPEETVQRACASCTEPGADDDERSLQRKADGNGVYDQRTTPRWQASHAVLNAKPQAMTHWGFSAALGRARASSGERLPDSVRSFMEPRFGQRFESVRLHRGVNATELAKSVGAKAFTVGQDLFFREGQFEPGTERGQRLIAHELTHVVQQRNGLQAVQPELVVQRQDSPDASTATPEEQESKRVEQLVRDYDEAIKPPAADIDWDDVAELLNGFSDEDILSRLKNAKLRNAKPRNAKWPVQDFYYLERAAQFHPRLGGAARLLALINVTKAKPNPRALENVKSRELARADFVVAMRRSEFERAAESLADLRDSGGDKQARELLLDLNTPDLDALKAGAATNPYSDLEPLDEVKSEVEARTKARELLIKKAYAYRGVVEDPPCSNRGVVVDQFNGSKGKPPRAVYSDKDQRWVRDGKTGSCGFAWCAFFVKRCLADARVAGASKLTGAAASVTSVAGYKTLAERWPAPGDIFYMSPKHEDIAPSCPGTLCNPSGSGGTGHTGIIVAVNGDEATTIEGNIALNSGDNDGVEVKAHSVSDFEGALRLPR